MNHSLQRALLAGSLVALPALASEVVPWGGDFLIGSWEFGTNGAASAMSPDGSFALGWDAGFCCMGAAGYERNGIFAGSWELTLHNPLFSFDPIDIAALSDDDFVVAWETYNPAFEPVILARRFALDGTPDGSGVEVVNGADGSANVNPAVASWPANSDFIVTWARQAPGTPGALNIHIDAFPVLKFPALRVPQGSFQVNTYTPGDQDYPELAVAADSSFVVVWRSDGSAGSDDQGKSVQARSFSSGSFGAQFQVNTVATGDQQRPDVASAADGRFLVVWDGPSTGSDPDRSIQGRMFDSDQEPLGPDFQINARTVGTQSSPAAVSRDDGSFLVVWRSTSGVWGRVIEADGSLAGGEQRLNSTNTELYLNPTLAGARNGSFVVTWDTEDSFYGNERRARLLRTSLFSDGFETGDTSAWSASVP